MRIPDRARQTLFRIMLATILLAGVLGAADWLVEHEQIDNEVVLLAEREAQVLTQEHLARLAAPEAGRHLAILFKPEQQRHFPIIELYDARRQKVFESIAPGRESLETALQKLPSHGFPFAGEPEYRWVKLEQQQYLQVLLPLKSDRGEIAGYFEGVYEIPVKTLTAIESGVMRAMGMVILAVLLTGAVIYPIVLRLNRDVLATSHALLRGNLELMEVMGAAIAQRDSDTHAHNYRVTLYALMLGQAIRMPNESLCHLLAGAFLHDVGKIGIPDAILLKPARLSEEEFATMRQHVAIARTILAQAQWLGAAIDVAEFHHEKFDGSGYLQGLRGEEIPLPARVFAIADVFDALTSRRPYKEPFAPQAALEMMGRDAGTHFDPTVFVTFAEQAVAWHGEITGLDEAALTARVREQAAVLFGLPAES